MLKASCNLHIYWKGVFISGVVTMRVLYKIHISVNKVLGEGIPKRNFEDIFFVSYSWCKHFGLKSFHIGTFQSHVQSFLVLGGYIL